MFKKLTISILVGSILVTNFNPVRAGDYDDIVTGLIGVVAVSGAVVGVAIGAGACSAYHWAKQEEIFNKAASWVQKPENLKKFDGRATWAAIGILGFIGVKYIYNKLNPSENKLNTKKA